MAPEASPFGHLQGAVVLEHFGRQVFLPYILAQQQQQQQQQAVTTPSARARIDERIFYATLLALREVLAQNAEQFFTLPTVRDQSDDPLSQEDIEEEEAYGKLLLATAIVMAACQDAGKDEHLLFQYMLNDNFPAVRATPRMTLRTPSASAADGTTTAVGGGGVLGEKEAVAFKAGYNVALAKRAAAAKENRTSIPEPTACWVSVVEEIPATLKNSKKIPSCDL